MARFLIKIVITSILIASISELGKRSTVAAGILTSLPIVSLMGMTWLYLDTGDATRVADLSTSIFWALLPSFLLFLSLPVFIRLGIRFPFALLMSCALMFGGYTGYVAVLKKLGVEI